LQQIDANIAVRRIAVELAGIEAELAAIRQEQGQHGHQAQLEVCLRTFRR
jgi:hypothetical protein